MPSSVALNSDARRLKIAVMGSGDVGKTSIIRGIVADPIAKLASICNTDVGLSYHVYIGNISLAITEVSLIGDNDISPSLTSNPAIETPDAFILVYAVDDVSSFDYMETVKDTIVESRSSDVPIIVVGNKTDSIRCGIAYEVVDCIVSIDWELYYTETSAKIDDSVTTILPSLFHHRKLRHHKFPSQIKTEYGSLPQKLSRSKTVNFTLIEKDLDNKRIRAQSDSSDKKISKQRRTYDVDETETDVFESMDNSYAFRRESVESMTFKSLLTDRTQNKSTGLPWHPSKLANVLKTANPRNSFIGLFNDLLSPGCSTSNSSASSSPSVNGNFGFKFMFETKKRSSLSSSIHSDANSGFSVSSSPKPMRKRCNTYGVRRQPRTEDAVLLANRRMSYSGSTERDGVFKENRNDWVSSVIRFLKK